MNGFKSVTKPLRWLMALLLVVFVAGCGGGGGDSTAGGGSSTTKAITAYSLAGVAGAINETAKTIAVTMPNGTNVTALAATFTTTGAGVKVGTTTQISGITPNDFTNPVAYIVTAADNSTAAYTVTVTVAPASAKAITAYSLAGVAGAINEMAKTIAVTMPSGTNVTALVATFTTTVADVKVGMAVQISGTTPNDFSGPVAYIVTAADGTTATYVVTVTVAPASAKALTAYSLAGIAGTINETAKTIAVTMPSGTNVTALIATFTTTGGSVNVNAVAQTSGATPNDFTNPVTYIVTAADNSTATYIVTVTVALNSAKAITSYSLAGVAGTINETAKTIAVTMPLGTNVTALVATFTTTGASVNINAVAQASGTTPNNFTNPVVYIVTAADSTTAMYTITVTVSAALGPPPVLLGAAGNFVVLSKTGVSTVPASVITGDVGVSPAATSYLTGFSLTMVGTTSATSTQVTGNLYGADMTPPTGSNLTTAVSNMEAAYTDAATRPAPPDFLNLGAGEIGGQVLTPGLYTWTTGVTISTNVTISGGANDVWIFQIPGNLDMSAARTIILGGSAKAKNIFWQVAGTVGIGATAHFEGIILSQTSITLGNGASMNGRALAQTAVILDQSAVTAPAP